jgi:hypothetical protein
MLLAAGLLDNFTYRHIFIDSFQHRAAYFCLWLLPYNAAITLATAALLFVRSRRANIVLLATVILLLTIPYWEGGNLGRWIVSHVEGLLGNH